MVSACRRPRAAQLVREERRHQRDQRQVGEGSERLPQCRGSKAEQEQQQDRAMNSKVLVERRVDASVAVNITTSPTTTGPNHAAAATTPRPATTRSKPQVSFICLIVLRRSATDNTSATLR